MSVLFVHTDSDDRAMYAEYLRGEGYAVRELGKTDDALPTIVLAIAAPFALVAMWGSAFMMTGGNER